MYLFKFKTTVKGNEAADVVNTLQAKAPYLEIANMNKTKDADKDNYAVVAKTANNLPNDMADQPLVQLGNFPTDDLVRLCDNPMLGDYVSTTTKELVNSYAKLKGSYVDVRSKFNGGMEIIEVHLSSEKPISIDVFKEICKKCNLYKMYLYEARYNDNNEILSLKEYAVAADTCSISASITASGDAAEDLELNTKVALELNMPIPKTSSK